MKYLYLLCLIFLFQPPAFGQLQEENAAWFRPVTARDGENLPWAGLISRDSHGFFWFSTREGLVRYDGYQFRVFTPRKEDSLALPGSFVGDFAEAANGHIWLAQRDQGLTRYDPVKETFARSSTWLIPSEKPFPAFIKLIQPTSTGQIWVVGDSVMGLLDPRGDKFTWHLLPPQPWQPFEINDLQLDPTGDLWISSGTRGLIQCQTSQWSGDPQKMDFQQRHFTGNTTYPLPLTTFGRMKCDRDGLLWIIGDGLLALDPRSQKVIKFWSESELNPAKERNPLINVLPGPGEGECALLSSFKIYQLSLHSTKIKAISPFQRGIPNSGVNAFYGFWEDAETGGWIGSIEGSYQTGNPRREIGVWENESESAAISAVLAEGDSLWVGKEKGGILLYKRDKTSAWQGTQPEFLQQNGLENAFITGMVRSREGRLFIATYGAGLWREKEQKGEFEMLQLPRPDRPQYYETYYFCLKADPEGGIWAGTTTGAHFIPPGSDQSKFVISPVTTDFLLEDDQKWMVTEKGLFRLFFEKDSLVAQPVPFHAGERMIWMKKSRTGQYLLGTLNGFSYGSLSDSGSKWIDQSSGLPGTPVKAAFEMPDGKWWFGTQKGLCRWDPVSGACWNLDQTDGLPGLWFASHAVSQSPDGTLYFGTRNGLIGFHPDSLQPSATFPPVCLTGFRLFNQYRHPLASPLPGQNSDFVLDSSLVCKQKLVLSWKEDLISIEFAALEYVSPKRIRYRYRLDGFNPAWIETDYQQRSATYTNLDPGTYQFRVQASNRDGIWSPAEARLTLVILPPWWQSRLAWVSYGVAFLLLIYLGYRLRLRQIRRKWETQRAIEQAQLEAREMVRQESSRDFHDEAGSRITRTNLYAELLKTQLPPDSEASPTLEKLQENLREISGIVREFIWLLDPAQDELSASLLRIRKFGEELFTAAGIEFTFQLNTDPDFETRLELKTRRHLVLLFKEAMQNIVKHAAASQVSLEISPLENGLCMTLKDNGKGFSREKLARVNGIRHMENRAREMKAEFSLESEEGKGTRIQLKLPFPQITQMGNGKSG